jgi:hypothetical protein
MEYESHEIDTLRQVWELVKPNEEVSEVSQ